MFVQRVRVCTIKSEKNDRLCKRLRNRKAKGAIQPLQGRSIKDIDVKGKWVRRDLHRPIKCVTATAACIVSPLETAIYPPQSRLTTNMKIYLQ